MHYPKYMWDENKMNLERGKWATQKQARMQLLRRGIMDDQSPEPQIQTTVNQPRRQERTSISESSEDVGSESGH